METVKGLNECPKEYVYFSQEYVEPKAEAMPTS
jgi:hypothetical protein